jgi:energy-coupling factor transport system permease protein
MASSIPVLYQARDSVVHRCDARVKLILFALLFLFLFIAPNWKWMIVPLVLGLLLALMARTQWKWLLVLWVIHLPSILVLLGLPLFEMWRAGKFELNDDLEGGLRLALAWTAAIIVSVSLFSTVRPDHLRDGLRALGIPAVAAFAVGLTYRLLYTALTQVFDIAGAMRLKGVELDLRHPIRLVKNSMIISLPILFAIMRRGPTLMAALETRGALYGPPSRLHRFTFRDMAFLGTGLTVVILAAGVRFGLIPELPVLGG